MKKACRIERVAGFLSVSLILLLVIGCASKKSESVTEPTDVTESMSVEKAAIIFPDGYMLITSAFPRYNLFTALYKIRDRSDAWDILNRIVNERDVPLPTSSLNNDYVDRHGSRVKGFNVSAEIGLGALLNLLDIVGIDAQINIHGERVDSVKFEFKELKYDYVKSFDELKEYLPKLTLKNGYTARRGKKKTGIKILGVIVEVIRSNNFKVTVYGKRTVDGGISTEEVTELPIPEGKLTADFTNEWRSVFSYDNPNDTDRLPVIYRALALKENKEGGLELLTPLLYTMAEAGDLTIQSEYLIPSEEGYMYLVLPPMVSE